MVGVEAVDIGIAKDTSVTMFNNISRLLIIHCQEKGYDDGFHHVSPGESYRFTLGILKFIHKSLWFCREHFTPLTFMFKKEIKSVVIMGVPGI
ncbi:hypothetical protein Lal_00005799 [Lupinus albus]|nr:hypothetical protein Lal_00005799 [Lupinus albus]